MARTTKNRTTLALALAGITLLGGALYFAAGTQKSPAPKAPVSSAATPSSAQPAVLAFRWVQGQAYDYALTYSFDSKAVIEGVPEITTHFDLAGKLVMRAHGSHGDNFLLAVSFEDVTKSDAVLLGSNVLPDEASTHANFDGQRAWVEVDPLGHQQKIYFDKNSPPLFRQMIQMLISETAVTLSLGETRAWAAQEIDLSGELESKYAALDGAPLSFVRTRSHYDKLTALPPNVANKAFQDLTARATVRLDPRGVLSELTSRSSLRARLPQEKSDALASETRIGMHLTGVSSFALDPAFAFRDDEMDSRKPGDYGPRATAEQALTRQAAGLTMGELEGFVNGVAGGRKLDRDAMTRTVAYLRLHPEDCARMVTLFTRPGMSATGKEVVMDMLTSAGTKQAQAAMRAALSTDEARSDKQGFQRLVQRVGLILKPVPESAAYLAKVSDEAGKRHDTATRSAALFALGSATGKLAVQGESELAQTYNAKLLADLASAETPAAVESALGAVGNAGLLEDAAAIEKHAADSDPNVRSQVATSLRKVKTPDAKQTLFTLLCDSSMAVAMTAASTLTSQTLTDEDWATLADLLTNNRANLAVDVSLLNLVSAEKTPGPSISAVLRAIIARNPNNDRVVGRATVLLQYGAG